MVDTLNGSFVEGIGDEVLITFVIGIVIILLVFAWYSTHLTSSQARLTSLRVDRRVVTLNRLPGSSTTESRADAQQLPRPSEELANPGADVPVDVDSIGAEHERETGDLPATDPPDLAYSDQFVDEAEDDIHQTTDDASENIDGIDCVENTLENLVDDTTGCTESTPDGVEVTEDCIEVTEDVSELGPGCTVATEQPTEEVEGNEEQVTAESELTDEASAEPDSIQVRLKFLSEEERVVRSASSDTVAQFKQRHFTTELSENKLVRLIFKGQVLQDNRTLQSYEVIDNTTVHVVVTENTSSTYSPQSSAPDAVPFNAGVLMVPLFAIILAMIWYLRLTYAEIFNLTSTASLLGITIVFVLSLVAQRAPIRPQNVNRHRTYAVR